jgi:AcrR family transcriptional regulator
VPSEAVADPRVTAATRKRDRRPEQTVRKLLDAGREELQQTSFSTLTMRMVAARAGVSPASAYTYFPSKSALVAAIYLGLLRRAPVHTDVNQTTRTRVSTTLREMALVVADEPELTAACSAALMADDPAVTPIREQIGTEVITRIQASLGPGWAPSVATTLLMTFAGALMTARFLSFDQIAGQLDDAVGLVLGGPD